MFKIVIPVSVVACTLALSLWPTFVADSTYETFGWALAGMVMLYMLSNLIQRRNGSMRPVAHILAEAAQVNAARVAVPPVESCRHRDEPRR
jgi:hypothetical protein